MKILITILFLVLFLYGDMGDCLTCHSRLLPNINEDERHSPMQTCIKCHSANKTGVLECGEKCFSCHSKEDLSDGNIEEHLAIEECRECHINVIHDLFDATKSFDQSQSESLKDFLIQ